MYGNVLAAIRLYKERRKNNPDSCLSHCKSQKLLSDAIFYAAISEDNLSKKHSHQFRLKKKDMLLFAERLKSEEIKIKKADDFDILFKIVNNVGNKMEGIGDMLIYDATERIGQYLNLFPEKVYLHAGTRIGAEKILGRRISSSTIKKEMFPEPIKNSKLSCADIERMLCMYKDMFYKSKANSGGRDRST